MHPRTIGFIGKTSITPEEENLLTELGYLFAKSGYPTVLIAQKGACEAVRVGLEVGGGEIITIEKDTISQSAHCFVYADERMLSRLRTVDPSIETNPKILLSLAPEGIREWLGAARIVLSQRGITFS
jgi:hypothetical protein